MPLPLLLVPAAITAAVGIVKGKQAIDRTKESKEVFGSANDLIEEWNTNVHASRERANNELDEYGRYKMEVISTSIRDFVDVFKRIKNIELNDTSQGLDELNIESDSEELLTELEFSVVQLAKILGGGIASVGSGAAVAFGAYSATMALGTASTGAAITGLSGVAATNATLAWLGGGALATGGAGIAGGTLVLGGLVLGPALAVAGTVLSAAAKKRLNEAKASLVKAETFREDAKLFIINLDNIQDRVAIVHDTLLSVNKHFIKYNEKMKDILFQNGLNWADYTAEQKAIIHRTFLMAQVVKGIIDTPILSEDGELTTKSLEIIKSSKLSVQEIMDQQMSY
ncbi:hypothetical protein ACI2JA_01445 [Alkalihalobacillus sp. NPDC078783]